MVIVIIKATKPNPLSWKNENSMKENNSIQLHGFIILGIFVIIIINRSKPMLRCVDNIVIETTWYITWYLQYIKQVNKEKKCIREMYM